MRTTRIPIIVLLILLYESDCMGIIHFLNDILHLYIFK
jgi:hypothetical protein